MTRRQAWLIAGLLAGILLVLAWPGITALVYQFSPVDQLCTIVDLETYATDCKWVWR